MTCALDGCELAAPDRHWYCTDEHRALARKARDAARPPHSGHKYRASARPTCNADGCELPRGYGCWRYCSPAHRPQRPSKRLANPFGGMRRLDDIDEVAVQRAIEGIFPVTLNRGERRAVVAELTRRGFAAKRIAERNGSTPRTVVRDRAVLRAAA